MLTTCEISGGSGDVGDGDVTVTASANKENLLERLNKRNKDRQNCLDVKLEQRNRENVRLEGVDYFSQTFADRVHEIEKRIQNIKDVATSKSDLTLSFADITVEIQELQRYLTTSTMFLADYKIKACQNILNELTNSCEESRLKLMPKKKFGFSGKKVAPKAIVNPKVIAVGDTLDAPHMPGAGTSNTTDFSWTLSNRKDEYICLRGTDVNGKDVTISDLRNCFVELQGHAGSVQISQAVNCVFLCGPIARSLFAEHCQSSTLALACQQLRLHSSEKCRIYLHVTCRAIIEDCTQIEIADYNYNYATIDSDFVNAGLDKAQNNYTDVADFNWLSPNVPSPNWKLLKGCTEQFRNWCELRKEFNDKLN